MCGAYAKARNPQKDWKKKQLLAMREYVINELPALLHGIEYEGNMYTLMLHPTLKTDTRNESSQREAMVMLLEHMRTHYVSNIIDTTSPCYIFDIEVPHALIKNKDESLTNSSRSSFLNNHNSNSSHSSIELAVNIPDSSGFLWLILALQVN